MMCTPKRDPGAAGTGRDEPCAIGLAELEALAARAPAQLLRSGPGRETFSWRSASGVETIVKRYRGTGGLEAWRERLSGKAARSPGRREYELLVELAEADVPVPRALACHESGGDLSLVVMEQVAHHENLRERLTREPERAAAYFDSVFAIADRLHGGGWYHRDLYLDHFLVVKAADDRGSLVLIDVGRARRAHPPRRRWFVKDLAALWHSTPIGVPPVLALRFLAKWLKSRGIRGRATRRRIWRAVVAKEQRMAAHEPRGGTSYPEAGGGAP